MEVTKREILVSIIILFMMLGIGSVFYNMIYDYNISKNEIYLKSLKIDNNSEHFIYSLKTNVGNTMVFGEIKAVDELEDEELNDKYFAIKKDYERYTMHTRVVTTSNGKTTTSRVETYYTWDNIKTEKNITNEFELLGNKFNSNKINFTNYKYIKTTNDISRVGNIRCNYYIIPLSFNATIFTIIKDNTINNTEIYYNTINEVIKQKQNFDIYLILFCILWVIIIGLAIYGYMYLDNNYLE